MKHVTEGDDYHGTKAAVIVGIDPDDEYPLKLDLGSDLLKKDDQIKVDGQWWSINRWKLKKCGTTETIKGFQNLADVMKATREDIENNTEDVY